MQTSIIELATNHMELCCEADISNRISVALVHNTFRFWRMIYPNWSRFSAVDELAC
jgi:hypothetical protein